MALEELTEESNFNINRPTVTPTLNRATRLGRDAFARRDAVPLPQPLRKVILPRVVVRGGIPSKPDARECRTCIAIGSEATQTTEWTTTGLELPRDSDWRWYAAITSRCFTGNDSRVALGSVADLHRLGSDLGCKRTGGSLTRQCALAMARLAESRFGWVQGPKGASPVVVGSPIIEVSSALAAALWKDDAPSGAIVIKDDTYWVQLAESHQTLLISSCFMVPVDVFRRVSTNPVDLVIALWVAVTAQSAQKPYSLRRQVVEELITSMTGRAREKTLLTLHSAMKALADALKAAGFDRSVKVDVARSPAAKMHPSRGRPVTEWTMVVHPAGKPFKSRA